ncbi:MAG: N-acetylmuramoyl-L-alanine amidase [Eubacteriales bacterium]|nr:N-acetylmuramoyl-L-alanine amidase [Eubacteriales bacterium]
MKRFLRLAALLLLLLYAAGCAAAPAPSSDAMDFAEPTKRPEPVALVGTPAPSGTPTPSPSPIPYEEPLFTPTPAPDPAASPAAEDTPSPTETPTVTPKAQTPTPAPTKTPDAAVPPVTGKPLSGYTIGIDPGHQSHANRDKEPEAPGSSTMKNKVSSGTYGRFSGVREYVVNLDVGLALRDSLEALGATVVMTRTTNDVDISNVERAKFFNEKKTDYALRLHCNGSDDASKAGAFMLIPKSHPYKDDCKRAAELLIDAYCSASGFKNKGITVRSDQTGFNWCERMIVNIEMGHMTNESDDHMLTDPAVQKKMVQGLTNGIVAYFAS